MARKVTWSKSAVADRIQILDFWYRKLGSKSYSKKLDQGFRKIITLLSRFPSLGRAIEDREERYVIKNYYRIIYRINSDNDIEVLRIWDTRKNPDEFTVPE